MQNNYKTVGVNFIVAPDILDSAYQGDVQALLAIAKKAQSEKRLGIAQNFFRLAEERRKQQSETAA